MVSFAVTLENHTCPSRTSASQLYSGPVTASSTNSGTSPARRAASSAYPVRSGTCSIPTLPAAENGLTTTGSRAPAQSAAAARSPATR